MLSEYFSNMCPMNHVGTIFTHSLSCVCVLYVYVCCMCCELFGKANTYLRLRMATIVMLPAELGDHLLNKDQLSPTERLLPDHFFFNRFLFGNERLGYDAQDVDLDQEPAGVSGRFF